jgi:hypothetical protein
METGKLCFQTGVITYRMIDHKCNEDIREEMRITDINIVRNYHKKWPEYFETCIPIQSIKG